MPNYLDYTGEGVRLTEERIEHILTSHPEMKPYMDAVPEVLSDPHRITSDPDPSVQRYYRLYGTKYVCVVVKKTPGDAFVVTAHPSRRIR